MANYCQMSQATNQNQNQKSQRQNGEDSDTRKMVFQRML